MVELEPGETVLKTGPVRWVGREGERAGVLTLTNHALIFDGPVPPRPPGAGMGGGPMRRRAWAAQRGAGPPVLVPGTLRIALWRCRGAAAIPGPSGNDLGVQLLQRSFLLRTSEADAWAPAIRQARASAPPPPPGAMGAGRGGVPANLHCDYCGKQSSPPATRCTTCGAPFEG